MHSEVASSNVPAFLTKLWKLVEDSDYDHLISWGPNGKSFIIRNQARFSKELLPLYFKHNNMASFIRQLNMYGFRKIANIENSGLRLDNDEIEFYHAYFLKDQENLLEFIKRKVRNESAATIGNTKALSTDDKLKKEEVESILSDMKGIKGKQESIDSFLINLRRENEALWREVALLRQKHQKQQQIVEKLIQFFLTLVHNRGLGIKRNFPLMIDGKSDGSNPSLRVNLVSPPENIGPVIHDVTDHLLEDESFLNVATSNGSASNSSNSVASCSGSGQSRQSNGALIEENSKSPFSTNENIENIENELKASTTLDPLELAFAETQVNNDGLVDTLPLSESLDHLNETAKNNDLFALEEPLDDQTNLIEEQVIDSNNQIANKTNDPLQLETMTNTTALTQPALSTNTSLVPSTSSVLNTPTYTIENIDDHLEGIDTELSWLQEQLALGGLNLDPSTLMGVGLDSRCIEQLFSSEDDLLKSTNSQGNTNNMIQYTPKALPTSVSTNQHAINSNNLALEANKSGSSFSNLLNTQADENASTVQATSGTYQPIKYAYPSLVSSNESAATLYDSSNNPTSSLLDSNPVDLLDSSLTSTSLADKQDIQSQFDQINDSSLFDAADLLNSESDIDNILESKTFGSDKKRRKIA